jgi:hypothetical protein
MDSAMYHKKVFVLGAGFSAHAGYDCRELPRMRTAVILRHPSTTWAFVTMKPSAETRTPLASEDSSADSSHVRNNILLAKRLKIASADISPVALPERESSGRSATGGP